MPLPSLWNALFFFLIIILGIDSQVSVCFLSEKELVLEVTQSLHFLLLQFSGLEAFATVLSDQYPRYFRTTKRRMASVAAICIVYFFIGLPFVMNVRINRPGRLYHTDSCYLRFVLFSGRHLCFSTI